MVGLSLDMKSKRTRRGGGGKEKNKKIPSTRWVQIKGKGIVRV